MYFSYLNGTAICMVKGRNLPKKKINFLFCLCHCLYLNNFEITVLYIDYANGCLRKYISILYYDIEIYACVLAFLGQRNSIFAE